mmetsp:Transcript_52247/g.146999  ORF Transcript_52247/g.146999 Transcript_52247/m.146999 type:complete len:185 (+) Transcript_52247:74-628(+)
MFRLGHAILAIPLALAVELRGGASPPSPPTLATGGEGYGAALPGPAPPADDPNAKKSAQLPYAGPNWGVEVGPGRGLGHLPAAEQDAFKGVHASAETPMKYGKSEEEKNWLLGEDGFGALDLEAMAEEKPQQNDWKTPSSKEGKKRVRVSAASEGSQGVLHKLLDPLWRAIGALLPGHGHAQRG